MCKANVELMNHLLLHCPIARDLWGLFTLPSWTQLGNAQFCSCYAGDWRSEVLLLYVSGGAFGKRGIIQIFEGNELSLPNLKFLFLKTL